MGALVTFTLLILNLCSIGANNLKLSVLMFRHGDRSPISTIPNDIYNSSDSWPQGPGQLSTIGMENHLRNGKFFRDRYTEPNSANYLGLNPDYKRKQVHVRSTDKERTLMSAESFLSGLFPPTENNLSSPLDVWQPIPVHTVPLNSEKMLDGPPQNCKEFEEGFIETVMSNPVFMSFMETKTNTTKKINEICGWPESTNLYSTFETITWTYDILFCEKSHNYTLKKEFVEEGLYDLVVPYADMEWKLYNIMSDQEKAFTGGVLLRELKTRVRAVVEKQDDIKLVIFSGHDTTLASILTCLGVYDGVQTPYATVLMLEVWETEDGGHVIKFLRHHKDDGVITYTLPGCDESGCTLDQFYSLNENLELSEKNIIDECNGHWPDFVPSINKNVLFMLLCLTILITLSTVIVLIIYMFSVRKQSLYSGLAAEDQKQALLDGDEI